MHLAGLTVCVDFSDHFAQSIERWRRGFDQMLVVTTPGDIDTIELCAAHNVPFYTTDVFSRGAWFNKAGAMNQALAYLHWSDWLVCFDADIVPPPDWRKSVQMAEPRPGDLYGAHRYRPDGRMEPDQRICGWFMMSHRDDPVLAARGGYPGDSGGNALFTEYNNASGYDSDFEHRWPDERHIWIERLQLVHLGERETHWCGRGNRPGMAELRENRDRRGGYDHERL